MPAILEHFRSVRSPSIHIKFASENGSDLATMAIFGTSIDFMVYLSRDDLISMQTCISDLLLRSHPGLLGPAVDFAGTQP